MELQKQLLSFGSQGEDVRRLQEALKKLGYSISPTETQGSIFGEGTLEALRHFQDANKLTPSEVLEGHTAHMIESQYEIMRSRTVRGRVHYPDGRPVANYLVRLLDKRLEEEFPIVSERCFDNGNFELIYTLNKFNISDPMRIALRISVVDGAGKELTSSDTLYNPGPEEVVDLQLPSPAQSASEYKQLRTHLLPLLKDADLTALSQEQINYVIKLSGLERVQVERLVESHGLAHSLGIPEEFAYVLRREGIATSQKELLEKPQNEILAAVERAVQENRLGDSDAKNIKNFVQGELAEKQVESLLRDPEVDEAPTLGAYVNTVPSKFRLGPKTPRKFARLVVEKGADAEDIWKRAKEVKLPNRDISTLKVVSALRDLTSGHLAMMAKLHEKRSDKASSDSIEFLARLKPVDWLNMTYTVGLPPNSQLTAGDYARQLEANVEAHFPTRVLAERLRQGVMKLDGFPTTKVNRFLNQHSDFDIGKTHIEPYLHDQGVNDEALKNALMRVQRARALAENWREAGVLFNHDFDSASKIIRYGRDHFRKNIGKAINWARLNHIYDHAQEIYFATLHLAFEYSPQFTPGGTHTIVINPTFPGDKNSDKTIPAVLQQYPTLRSLFGDLDYCECRHCQSVLGPAAYFVDLLQFLQQPNEKVGGSVLSALLARRPDLVDLDLSCENTNTEIPYIDLVLELLENAVALRLNVTIPAGVDIAAELEKGRIPASVLSVLQQTAIKIGSPLNVEKIKKQMLILGGPTQWIIRDGSRRWLLWHWKRQLNRRLLPLDIPLGPVGLQNLDAAIQALELGTLDSQLLNLLAPEPNLPIYGTPSVTKPDARTWRVRYVRGVAIRITFTTTTGTAEVLTLDGANILKTLPINSLSYFRQVEGDLASGKTDQVMSALKVLDLPEMNYQVTQDNTNNWWDVRISGDETFSLQPERLSVEALTYQNSSIQEDLLAYPENRNPEAYNKLAEAVYPWSSLPFSLWLEESRPFLENLGVSRKKLMELCKPALRWQESDIAFEILGFSKKEAELIAPAQSHTKVWRFWGLTEKKNNILDHFSGDTRTGDWLLVARRVSILLQQTA
jgi:peptidoglycan hydrolase-like protein with peptidoglycan-binding domain